MLELNCVCVCVCFFLHLSILQYFLPFAKDGINRQIETAILRANKMGVKVVSLAALNKVGPSVVCAELQIRCFAAAT